MASSQAQLRERLNLEQRYVFNQLRLHGATDLTIAVSHNGVRFSYDMHGIDCEAIWHEDIPAQFLIWDYYHAEITKVSSITKSINEALKARAKKKERY